MTVEGSGEIIRNRGTGGGAVTFIDNLYWNISGSNDSDDFTITVTTGETLLISAWWDNKETDPAADFNVVIDGSPIAPTVGNIVTGLGYHWPATFWTRQADLSPGDHTIGVVKSTGMDTQGGMVIFHIIESLTHRHHNAGGG